MDGPTCNSTTVSPADQFQTRVDPCGRIMLSYRRSHAGDLAHIAGGLLDRGVPIWQDIRDLRAEALAGALRETLNSPTTAGALGWISADVRDSVAILEIEAPIIIERDGALDDPFFAELWIADDLTYEEAAHAYQPAGMVLDIAAERNLPRAVVDATTKRIDAREGCRIALAVLHRRLAVIHRLHPPDEPLKVLLCAHGEADTCSAPGFALQVNWSRHFNDRLTTPEIWDQVLLPALKDLARAVRKSASGRRLRVEGRASLGAALAFGFTFRSVTDIPVTWVQTPGPIELSLDAVPVPSGVRTQTRELHLGSKDLAVLVCVASDVEPALAATTDAPRFRAMVKIQPPAGSPRLELRTPGQFVDVSRHVVDAIRSARHQFRSIERTHLYFAGPAGLAMLVGQQLNALGPIHTYEHEQHGGVGRYVPAAILSDQHSAA